MPSRKKSAPKQKRSQSRGQTAKTPEKRVTRSTRSNKEVEMEEPSSVVHEDSEIASDSGQLIFPEGDFVAFVDPEGDFSTFDIAQLVADLQSNDESVKCHIYHEDFAFHYKKISKEEYLVPLQIVDTVKVSRI